MRYVTSMLLAIAFGLAALQTEAKDRKQEVHPGCAQESAQQCLQLALDAMGGRARLEQLKSVRLQNIGHTLLMEQSYRQSPFITSYSRDITTIDLANKRLVAVVHSVWPESDPNQSDSDTTLIVGHDGGVYRSKDADSPCSLSDLAATRQMLALGPQRLLLTASAASDLHFEEPQSLRSTPHTVIAFTWEKVPVRILINEFNHLPDAVETTQVLNDFWYFWGDVRQRIYFDNWKLVQGITYPSNLVEERNGTVWNSSQALNIEFNVPVDDKLFVMDEKAAIQSASSAGWNRPFRAAKSTALAPGIDLFPGSWNATIVKQSDGIVILGGADFRSLRARRHRASQKTLSRFKDQGRPLHIRFVATHGRRALCRFAALSRIHP